jgi:hypothetical protein
MIRGNTPTRNFRLTDADMEILDSLVAYEGPVNEGSWYWCKRNRSDVIRTLIHNAKERIEKDAMEKLAAELNKPIKKKRLGKLKTKLTLKGK